VIGLESVKGEVSTTQKNKMPRKRTAGRETGSTREATKTQLMEGLHEWLFRRPHLDISQWVDGDVADLDHVRNLFQAYDRETQPQRMQMPEMPQMSQLPVSDEGLEDDGYGGGGDEGDLSDDVQGGEIVAHVAERDDTWEFDEDHLSAHASDVGSDDGMPPMPPTEEESGPSIPNMDQEVMDDFNSYEPLRGPLEPIVRQVPAEFRGRVGFFLGKNWTSLVEQLLVGDQSRRFVKGRIPSNYSIWAGDIAPDQAWEYHGWTQTEEGEWRPPSGGQTVDDMTMTPVPDGDIFGVQFGKYFIRYVSKMISPTFIQSRKQG